MSDPAPETPEPPAPQFRKTKQGKWAVMGPIETLQTALDDDGKVKVLKKNGEWSSFTVKSLGRPFDVEGVEMAYGYDDEGDAGASSNAPSGGSSKPSSPSGQASEESWQRPPGDSSYQMPTRDESEPLPDYQGGAEDEWQNGF